MFKKKTVLIVGAGGSFELGLPVGDGLATLISEKLSFKNGRFGDQLVNNACDRLAKKHGEAFDLWQKAGYEISNAMPLALSIDNFLHTHSSDNRIVSIGKLAIVRTILEQEAKCDIYTHHHNIIDFNALHKSYVTDDGTKKAKSPSWHNVFFKMLTESVDAKEIDSVLNNVTVITFNYDRCIEHYLASAFNHYMRKTDIMFGRKLAKRLKVIHPYGQVGRLPDALGANIPFGAELSAFDLIEVSKQINTFTEGEADKTIQADMKLAIEEAETILCLGFSFGEMNLDLLQVTGAKKARTIIGTAFGVADSNREYIENRLYHTFKLFHNQIKQVHLSDTPCKSLLNNYWRMIMQ